MNSHFEKALNKCIYKLEPFIIIDGIQYYYTISTEKDYNWEGWKIIESYKNVENFPNVLDSIFYLKKLMLQFYKINYWDKLNLDSAEDLTLEQKTKILNCSIKYGVDATKKLLIETNKILNSLEDKYNNDEYWYWKIYDLLESQLLLNLIKSIPKKNIKILLEEFI